MRAKKISILTYHSIDQSNSVISVSAENFRAQIKFLHENNFKIISLKALNRALIENKKLPPEAVVLTFDDGFENFYTTAFPILREFGFTATVFLITDFCGKFNNWSGNLSILEPRKLMDWTKIKELSTYSIDFAAHSRTHPNLTELSTTEAENEMAQSKFMIEEHLGTEVTEFAYPYGAFNSEIKCRAEKYFKTAYSTNLGKVWIGDDPLSLKRIDAYYLQNHLIFKSVLASKFDGYLSLRQALRRLKSAWYNKS